MAQYRLALLGFTVYSTLILMIKSNKERKKNNKKDKILIILTTQFSTINQ